MKSSELWAINQHDSGACKLISPLDGSRVAANALGDAVLDVLTVGVINSSGGMGPDIGQPEGQGGRLVRIVTKPGTKPRTLLLGA